MAVVDKECGAKDLIQKLAAAVNFGWQILNSEPSVGQENMKKKEKEKNGSQNEGERQICIKNPLKPTIALVVKVCGANLVDGVEMTQKNKLDSNQIYPKKKRFGAYKKELDRIALVDAHVLPGRTWAS